MNEAMQKIAGRQYDGKLPVFAWPGGYTLLYITDDGAKLCGECAREEAADDDNHAPTVEAMQETYSCFWCDGCSEQIAGSYCDLDDGDHCEDCDLYAGDDDI